ncbi:hypothetical protein Tco_1009309 [Tanacetum coccineum]
MLLPHGPLDCKPCGPILRTRSGRVGEQWPRDDNKGTEHHVVSHPVEWPNDVKDEIRAISRRAGVLGILTGSLALVALLAIVLMLVFRA